MKNSSYDALKNLADRLRRPIFGAYYTFSSFKTSNMNKGELIDSIADSAGISKADAGRALDATMETITKCLKKGDKVTLPGFGTFSTSKRNARTGRNPSTGEAIKIKAKTVAKFKPGSKLSDAVN